MHGERIKIKKIMVIFTLKSISVFIVMANTKVTLKGRVSSECDSDKNVGK
jgi:hypothetical protein